MRVEQGRSLLADADMAVEEATRFMSTSERPDLVLVFCSTVQSAERVASAIALRFPGAPMAGCVTAGELLDEDHQNGGLVISSLFTPSIRWAVTLVTDVASFDAERAAATADDLFAQVGGRAAASDKPSQFCLTFIDGLSMREESVVSLMADALDGVPLVGGSSGDDLHFRDTCILSHGGAARGAAVFVLASTTSGFEIIKHQHYTQTDASLVITRADVATRRVFEMDGRCAIDAYAAALGVSPAEVTSELSFMNPLVFSCDGELYVRSIQKVEADGSIVFYCGIEEGMVLSIGGHEDMQRALDRDVRSSLGEGTRGELLIACNCILRALEATKRAQHVELGKTLAARARHVIGFDTYGEQLNGLHINQTLVGVLLFGDEATP